MFYFSSRNYNLTVVLKPSNKSIIGGEIVKTSGIKAEFKGGFFATEDPQVAQLLRDVKDPSIVEITAEDRAMFKATARGPKSIRGPMTAASVKKAESNLKVAEQAPKEFACPICDSKHKTQQALNLHLVGHRASVQDKKSE